MSRGKARRAVPSSFAAEPLVLACGQLLVSKQAWNCTKAVTSSKPPERERPRKKNSERKKIRRKPHKQRDKRQSDLRPTNVFGFSFADRAQSFPLSFFTIFIFFICTGFSLFICRAVFPHVCSRKICSEFFVAFSRMWVVKSELIKWEVSELSATGRNSETILCGFSLTFQVEKD